MRKVIFQMSTSLDGYFEGPNKEIDWHYFDQEFNEYAVDFLNQVDILLFGRVIYELMANYWPTKGVNENDHAIAAKMNNLPKIVFSNTLKKVDWNNSKLLKNNVVEEVKRLKNQPGNYLSVGGSDLALTLIKHKLIDEYRIIINPIFIGNGKTLFKGIEQELYLKLYETRTFKSGNILLCYRPG